MLCFIRIKEVTGLYKEKSRWTTNRSPGEINRREVSWTITKKLDFSGEIKSREVVLDPQDSPREIKSRARMHGKGFCYPAGKLYPGGSYRGGKNLVWFACMSHGRVGR